VTLVRTDVSGQRIASTAYSAASQRSEPAT
jgi:hypothetical protein